MSRKLMAFSITALLVTGIAWTTSAGGPPIVTIDKLPEYFVAGRPETFKFMVRAICCNHEPLDEKPFNVRAIADGKREIKVPAIPTGKKGQYSATLALPEAGEWTVAVDILYGANHALLPVMAIQQGSAAPQPLSQVALGERFFVEKGCVSCHVNREVSLPRIHAFWTAYPLTPGAVSAGNYDGGPPELTGRTFPVEYLMNFLSNPGKVRTNAKMPNLDLSREDIAALVAFINRDRGPAVSSAAR